VAAFGETSSSKLLEVADSFIDLSENKDKFLIVICTKERSHTENATPKFKNNINLIMLSGDT